jgi:hypothetical protein
MVNEPSYDFHVLEKKYAITNAESFFLHDVRGKFHCVNGPAVRSKRNFIFYNHGCLHNIDGPAIVREDKSFWYVQDVRIGSWDEFMYESGVSKERVLVNILSGKWPQNPFDY